MVLFKRIRAGVFPETVQPTNKHAPPVPRVRANGGDSIPSKPRVHAVAADSGPTTTQGGDVLLQADVPTRVDRSPAGAQEVKGPADESSHIIGQIQRALKQPWIGYLQGLVAPEMKDDLVALNLGLGDIALVGTAEAIKSSHAKHVKGRIEDTWNMSVVAECAVTSQVMGVLNERLSRMTGLTLDERNLSVYDDIVRYAVAARASDIHITTDSERKIARLDLRIFGGMRPWRKNHEQLILDAIASGFGQRAKASTNSRESFQATNPVAFMTQQIINGVQWEGRFNGRPHITGYSGVMRLLESNPRIESIPDLAELGYSKSHIDLITPAVKRNYGLIVMFGSTGSGKSTTLRTFITRVTNPYAQKVYTAENPAEYVMPGVVQFSLPVEVSMSSEMIQAKFTGLLRDVMRMDPDALMVGEVRDHETGRLSAEFTQSGHRCYTSAHGEGCVDGLARLCGGEIRMPPDTLSGSKFISASIYQRLLPKLCQHCRLAASHPEHGISEQKKRVLREKFNLDPGTMYVANPDGCKHCAPQVPGLKATGTLGVTTAVEILLPNADMRACIARRDWPGLDAIWRDQRRAGFGEADMSGKTAFEHAIWLVSQGIVSLRDVEADFEPIESYEVRQSTAMSDFPGSAA